MATFVEDGLPSLEGRWFNVSICCACWDRLNPDRKLEPARRAAIEASVAELRLDMDAVVDARCAACEATAHAGIYVRASVESLRAMHPLSHEVEDALVEAARIFELLRLGKPGFEQVTLGDLDRWLARAIVKAGGAGERR